MEEKQVVHLAAVGKKKIFIFCRMEETQPGDSVQNNPGVYTAQNDNKDLYTFQPRIVTCEVCDKKLTEENTQRE
jgi:hypothetical protein